LVKIPAVQRLGRRRAGDHVVERLPRTAKKRSALSVVRQSPEIFCALALRISSEVLSSKGSRQSKVDLKNMVPFGIGDVEQVRCGGLLVGGPDLLDLASALDQQQAEFLGPLRVRACSPPCPRLYSVLTCLVRRDEGDDDGESLGQVIRA
jgi:hypothetical protein